MKWLQRILGRDRAEAPDPVLGPVLGPVEPSGAEAPPEPQAQPSEADLPPQPAPEPAAAPPAAPRRQVPFVPRGLLRPFFFLHIPKTSGSSCNRFLARLYGEDNFAEHVEYHLPRLIDGRDPAAVIDAVSGHVPLCRWSLLGGTGAYARATLLRDPWARLVSHINWTQRFNNGKDLPPNNRAAGSLERVVACLATVDFANPDDLQRLFDTVNAEPDYVHFDNLQVRMLVTGSHRANFDKPGAAELATALENLMAFEVVGLCEDQAAFQAAMIAASGGTGVPEEIHENSGPSLGLTRDNAAAREIFAPWIAQDQALYDALRAARGL